MMQQQQQMISNQQKIQVMALEGEIGMIIRTHNVHHILNGDREGKFK